MVTIAALVCDPGARARLRAAVRSHATLEFCDDAAGLVAAVADGAATAVLTEWRDAQGSIVDSTIRSVCAEFPTVPVLLYGPLTPEGARDMLAAARAGVVDVVIANFDDVGVTLGRRLATAQTTALADRTVARLSSLVPPVVGHLLDYFFRHARSAPTVATAAAALHVHRKTLALHCARAGLPSPSALCCWARLILAAQRLDDPGRTTERAAMELGFPSGSAFRNMLKRYTGLSPSDLREHGSSVCLVELFAARLAMSAATADRVGQHTPFARRRTTRARRDTTPGPISQAENAAV